VARCGAEHPQSQDAAYCHRLVHRREGRGLLAGLF
jgi:hypothetical protein